MDTSRSSTSDAVRDKNNATKRAASFLQYITNRCDTARFDSEASACFDTTALRGLSHVTSDAPGHVRAELEVTKRVANSMGNLHGGCTATIVDVVGSAALATISNKAGVSVHISSEYVSGCPLGDTAVIDAVVLSMGRKLSTIEVKCRSKKTGRLIATGIHTKYAAEHEEPLNYSDPPQWQSKL